MNQSKESRIVLEFASRNFQFLAPYLQNQKLFEQELGAQVNDKGDNIGYVFDIKAEEILFQTFKDLDYKGELFSEESGWQTFGDSKGFEAFCDPFCNSTAARIRSLRTAASGLTIFDKAGELIAGIILDLNAGTLYHYGDNQFQVGTFDKDSQKFTLFSPDLPQEPESLDQAFVVMASEETDRQTLIRYPDLITQPKKFHITDGGHLYWGLLSGGRLDAYLDPISGEPLYEMFAGAIAQKAGVTITNMNGEPFYAKQIIETFRKDPKSEYQFIAARSGKIHKELLEIFQKK